MSYLGVDTSKDFTVNGMKYSKKIKMVGMSQKRIVRRRRHMNS